MNKVLLISTITFMIGLVIGAIIGVEITINKVVSIASGFVKVDKEMVEKAIFQYSNNIRECFNENALIYDNTGNKT